MSLYCECNIKAINNFKFSKSLRPNIGLIDPSPLMAITDSSKNCIGNFGDIAFYGELVTFLLNVV